MLQSKDIGYQTDLKTKQKQDPSICCLQETHFRPIDIFRLKVRGWRTIYHVTGSQNSTGVAILISDKLDFKIKTVTRDEVGHYNNRVYPSRRANNYECLCAKFWRTQIYKLINYKHKQSY